MIFKHRLTARVCLPLLSIAVAQFVGCRRPAAPPEKKAQPAAVQTAPAAEIVPPTVEGPWPVILVEMSYPGADARTVADTVAAPIEQQINGVEKLRSMRSQCRDDGSYLLAVEFETGVDPAAAQKLVQNRANLALPALPEIVKERGLTIKRAAPSLLMVCCISSDGKYDDRYLSNYARVELRDQLARLPGVGEVALIPEFQHGLRLLLDPEKMAARNLTVGDVATAVREQNLKAGDLTRAVRRQIGQPPPPPEPPGNDPQREIAPTQKLAAASAAEQPIEDIVVKTGSDGQVVYLRDVARLEFGGAAPQARASLKGKPVVVVAIWQADRVPAAEARKQVTSKLAELRAKLPAGLALDTSFDFAAGSANSCRYLLLDVTLPDSASAERKWEALERCQSILQQIEGVQVSLALSENPFEAFRNLPCMLVRLTADGGKSDQFAAIEREIRIRLESQLLGAAVAVRDFSVAGDSLKGGPPVDLAIRGPEAAKVNVFAEDLIKRLRAKQIFADMGRERRRERLDLHVDRAKAAAVGVSPTDAADTFTACMGPQQVGEFRQFAKTWPVVLQIETGPSFSRSEVEGIKDLKVRSAKGEMIPLSAIAEIRMSTAPDVVDRLDMDPMVEVTAASTAGASRAELRTQCETLAAEIRKELSLPATYQLVWLRPIPAAK